MDERITKAIKFFRRFDEKSDSGLYRRSVLKFCELVEERLGLKEDIVKVAEEVFNTKEEGDLKSA